MIQQQRFLGESNYGTFFRSALVDRSDQRPVLLAATAGGKMSLFIAGICFCATLNQKANRTSKEWISLFAADVYCMMYCLALSYLHIVVMEIKFSTQAKGWLYQQDECGMVWESL
jgi:hypothetical protein